MNARHLLIGVPLRGKVLEQAKAATIREAMRLTKGNITQAAELLGVHRQSLQRNVRRRKKSQ